MARSSNILWRCSLIAAMGGFLFGFDTAVISGAEKSIQVLFNLNGFWHGFTVAIALIGTVTGALSAGKPADIFGRKKILLIIAGMYFVSAIGSALANQWIFFLIFRFLGGLAVGASSVIGPMYIAEISPARKRGKLVAMFQLNVVTGILLAFLSNYIIALLTDNETWRWMLGVEALPALLFFVFLNFIPPTPRWLIMKERREEAGKILERLDEKNIEEQVSVIEESIFSERHLRSERFFIAKLKFPILLAFLVAFFNQFSGINAIMYYAPRIFEIAGIDRTSALFQSVAIGATNLVFTLIALSLIDRYGRKTLLLIGSVGMFFMLALVSMSFLRPDMGGRATLIGLIGYCAFFAASQGAVIWVFISEIFPNRVRAKGQAFGSFSHWILAALVSWIFPLFADGSETTGYVFLFFSLAMLIQFFVVRKLFPETRGKSLEQIQEEFGL